jgi:FkbM family methyltransferase
MSRERLMRSIWSLPVLRDLRVRRAIWNLRNALGAIRRSLFERLGSDRYSHPALHGMDRKLVRYLPERDGFFVEAGAYDGFVQSNTYWLERFRDWRGVLVEPIPHLWEQARRRRRGATVVNCALVPPDRDGEQISMTYGGLMSLVPGAKGGGADEAAHVKAGDMHGLDDTYEVTVVGRTLSSVLNEANAPPDIDLLSLDVEGFEAEVLRGLDLDRFRPRFMLIEMDEPDRRRADVEAVLGARYEVVEQLSPMDVLYRRTG